MQPIYFNPLDSTTNFIGTNPLSPVGVPVKTSVYPYFNPSIYQSFTFFSFPHTLLPGTFYSTKLEGSSAISYQSIFSTSGASITGSNIYAYPDGVFYTYETQYSYVEYNYYSTQFLTFKTNYASYYQIEPVTYSIRFGTELQTLYASTNGRTDTIIAYTNFSSENIIYFSDELILTYINYEPFGSTPLLGTYSSVYDLGGFTNSSNVISTTYPPGGEYAIGSSTFVNILGSNVYTGLIETTNSIIIYQNEQVSTYYSQSLSYQVNIANLTAALNSVSSGDGSQESGSGLITVTVFSWVWESSPGGWTGSQVTNFPNYLFTTAVNTYLFSTYGGTVITNSSVAVTQVQSLITVQNNNLANSQTFMNNAVTTLQSQVSLAGQIIGSLASIMQSIINNL